jgi:hypothetical protein
MILTYLKYQQHNLFKIQSHNFSKPNPPDFRGCAIEGVQLIGRRWKLPPWVLIGCLIERLIAPQPN